MYLVKLLPVTNFDLPELSQSRLVFWTFLCCVFHLVNSAFIFLLAHLHPHISSPGSLSELVHVCAHWSFLSSDNRVNKLALTQSNLKVERRGFTFAA